MWPWTTKPVLSIFVAIANNKWVKIIHFSFMPKIIRILRSCSMKIFCTFPIANISTLNFWLLICIAKNFIWTTLKMILSIFRFFCTLRFRIHKYCPNHTSMEILLIQLLCFRVAYLISVNVHFMLSNEKVLVHDNIPAYDVSSKPPWWPLTLTCNSALWRTVFTIC